jgi:transposase InsO family protein
MRYRNLRPDDAGLRARLRELAAVRRRFGYRRLLLLLRREGTLVNHKKLRRLYREERLQVRRRGRRKRALGTRAPLSLPQGPNQRWSLDFVSDTLTDSRRFRMLAFLDPADWATWLGEGGNDPIAAKAACKTTEGVRWIMTREERKASQKRSRPTPSNPTGLF